MKRAFGWALTFGEILMIAVALVLFGGVLWAACSGEEPCRDGIGVETGRMCR